MEDATDDIADDIHYMTTLLGEEVVMLMEKPTGTTLDFVAEVYEAMSLESLDAKPMHCNFDGIDHISTQDLSIVQRSYELQNTPMRFVSRPKLDTP